MDWFYEPILLRGSDYDASYLAGMSRFYAESIFLTNKTKISSSCRSRQPDSYKIWFRQ